MKESKPILDDFLVWIKYHIPKALPKSTFGTALNYCKNQWHKLTRFLKDGRLELDNNRSERAIRPFVIGRKNWIFSNTPKGAKASAIIYSVVETAKENNLKPFEYFKFILEKLSNIDIDDEFEIENLLPWSDNIPNYCKIKN